MRRGSVEQFVVVEKNDDGDKNRKKNRRSGRRSKQNSSSSVTEISVEASKGSVNGKATNNADTSLKPRQLEFCPAEDDAVVRLNVAYNSLSSMRVNGQMNSEDNQSSQTHDNGRADHGGKQVFKSCSEATTSQILSNSHANTDTPCRQNMEGCAQNRYFAPHWSKDAVNDALEKGDIFKAFFRVNAYNRFEAYCSIEGVPTDVLISGIQSQNRAVEGDIVAVKVDPLPMWMKMKGSVTSGINSVPLPVEDTKLLSECNDMASTSCKGKNKLDGVCEDANLDRCLISEKELISNYISSVDGPIRLDPTGPSNRIVDGCHSSALDTSHVGSCGGQQYATIAVGELCSMVSSFPLKRPTGKVLGVIEQSPRRDAVVGFLDVKRFLTHKVLSKKDAKRKNGALAFSDCGYIQMTPNDPKFPKMIVSVKGLPDCIKKRLDKGDATLEYELVGARIESWSEESLLPQACISHTFGHGGELESQVSSILYENSIRSSEFTPGSLASIPHSPWMVPHEEFKSRKDIRDLCIFTIDPSTATDLDDALSIERLCDGVFRVGIHIADVSYFVLPDTELDKEAQIRSTSVYMSRKKLPMLPSMLSENVGSLNAGVDRLAFSMFLDINLAGDVTDRLVLRTVIRSCCKLSYEQAQEIIDGPICNGSAVAPENERPTLHGQFEWCDVVDSVKDLHELSKIMREKRSNDGALFLESSKIGFLFDESGNPCDSTFCELSASNFLVEEFMLLANVTAAEIISRAFPDSALLRRHPEPNPRKLREFELFCSKHGLDLDTSSSAQIHLSLQQIREKLKDDVTLLDILINYAARPMQIASYFCNGDFKDSESYWAHYGLAVPLYTHFTSPLRRYPDIIVHRTLAAVMEAEKMYLKRLVTSQSNGRSKVVGKPFTGVILDKDVAESSEARDALVAAALKHGVPGADVLSKSAIYCNDRKLACRYVKDSCDKLYMWALLKNKKILFSEARVLGLGPRFMSIYIEKFAIEKRIYFDEVDGLIAEWLEATSTVVLNLHPNRRSARRGSPGKRWPIEDVALIVSPCDFQTNRMCVGNSSIDNIDASDPSEIKLDPLVFPITLRLLSMITVALHAIGGDNGPVDIGARLYASSYFG